MVKHQHHLIENKDGQRFRTDTTIPLSVKEHADIHKQYYEKWRFHEDYVAWKTLSGQIGKEELFIEKSRIGGLNNKDVKKSSEHKQKISKTLTGRKRSPATRKKIAESMKGNRNGKGHNQYTKKN